MYCKNCGKQIPDGTNWCPECGQDLRNIQPYQVETPHQQPNYQQQPIEIDKPSAGLNVLSFLFPVVGLVLYIVWKDTKPQKAKGCGKWALTGFILSFVFGFIIGLIGALAG